MIWSCCRNNDLQVLDQKYQDEFKMIREWLLDNDLKAITAGKYLIDGENVFVNVLQYETKNEKECIWEAHKKYLDLHLLISGEEILEISDMANMKVGVYEEEKDYIHVEGEADTKMICKAGTVLLIYPEEAHKTAVRIERIENIKKCVFKIKVRS